MKNLKEFIIAVGVLFGILAFAMTPFLAVAGALFAAERLVTGEWPPNAPPILLIIAVGCALFWVGALAFTSYLDFCESEDRRERIRAAAAARAKRVRIQRLEHDVLTGPFLDHTGCPICWDPPDASLPWSTSRRSITA